MIPGIYLVAVGVGLWIPKIQDQVRKDPLTYIIGGVIAFIGTIVINCNPL